MKVCPKCGKDRWGYQCTLTIRYTMTGCWGDSPETSGEEEVLHHPKVVFCSDCGARVPFKEATGEIERTQ